MRRWLSVAAAALFAACALLIASRTFNSISDPGVLNGRLADFRDAVYFPVRSLVDGNNPYDTPTHMALYPSVGQDFPLYAPTHLLFFIPFSALSFEAARAVHFVLTLGLILYLARLALYWVGLKGWAPTFALASAVVVSFPGRVVLQTGQTTALTAVGVWAAWRFRDRPWVSGACLAIAMFKPVIGVPVAAVFIAVRYVKPALIGLAASVVLAVPPLVALVGASGGIGRFVESIDRNLTYTEQNPKMSPRTGASTDLASLFARILDVDIPTTVWLLISLAVTALVLYVVVRCRSVAHGLDLMALAIPGVLLVGYQPTYHGILLVPVLVWVAVGPSKDLRSKWVVTALLGWIFVSPFATDRFQQSLELSDPLWFLGASTVCVCLVAVFALLARDLLSRRAAASNGSVTAAHAPTANPLPR